MTNKIAPWQYNSHCSKWKIVLDENVTPRFHHFPFIWTLVMPKLAKSLSSVSIYSFKSKTRSKLAKNDQICPFLTLFLSLLPWIPTEFSHIANFDITKAHMNGKYSNWGVTFSSRTFSSFEQCVMERWQKNQAHLL